MGCAIGIFCVVILLCCMFKPSQREPDVSQWVAAASRANPNNLPMNQAEAAADPYYQPMMAPEEEERVGMPPPDGDDMMPPPEEEERVGMPPPEGDAMMM